MGFNPCLLYIVQKDRHPFVVKAQTVDEGLCFFYSEDPGFGIAFLGQGRDGAHLNVTKTHRGKGINGAGIFVQPSGQAHSVWKFKPHQLNGVVDHGL